MRSIHHLDSSGVVRGGGGVGVEGEEGVAVRIMKRWCSPVLFSLGCSFLLSFVLGLVAIAMGSLSVSNTVMVPALCTIASSSVDIKSSRVCELGFLNYKARHVFHPKEKTTFRCRDDYYWASIFEVEFKEYFSGQILHAVVEAPKEALSQDCRPSFDTVWMTKMKFKVNGTYNCRYTLGSQKADIYSDILFNCQGKNPSIAEMIRRFLILLRRSVSEKSTSSSSGRQMGYTVYVAGMLLGMLTCLCCIILIKILQALGSSLSKHNHLIFFSSLRRACLLLAYISAVVCLLLQYSRIIGFKQLYFNSNLRDQIM